MAAAMAATCPDLYAPVTTRDDSRHSYTRTMYRNRDGHPVAGSLIVHGGGHAWYGGSSADS